MHYLYTTLVREYQSVPLTRGRTTTPKVHDHMIGNSPPKTAPLLHIHVYRQNGSILLLYQPFEWSRCQDIACLRSWKMSIN